MVYKQKGCVYRGEWHLGNRSGRGFWRDSNGHQWIGNWTRGRLFGKGMFFAKVPEPEDVNANSQDVALKRGAIAMAQEAALKKARGSTSFHVEIGEKFVGEFNNSQRRGRGRATYGNGDVYEGDWFANLKHGFGTYWYTRRNERYVPIPSNIPRRQLPS